VLLAAQLNTSAFNAGDKIPDAISANGGHIILLTSSGAMQKRVIILRGTTL
jgi:hypothetical protein